MLRDRSTDLRRQFFFLKTIGIEFIKNRAGNDKNQQNEQSLQVFYKSCSLFAFSAIWSIIFAMQPAYLSCIFLEL